MTPIHTGITALLNNFLLMKTEQSIFALTEVKIRVFSFTYINLNVEWFTKKSESKPKIKRQAGTAAL